MKLKVKLNSSICYIILLAVTLFYFAYRYVLKWANESTSGTYSTTPIAVQAAKYLICFLLLFLALIFSYFKYHCISVKSGIAMALIFFLFASSSYAFLIVQDQNTLVIFLGMSVVFTMMLTAGGGFDFESMDKLLIFFFYVDVIYEAVQVILYLLEGRLPAIAWADAGIIQVRFGGIFDDPFAQSLFMAFLIPYVYHRFTGLKKWCCTGLAVIMLILTWTLTSTFAIMGSYALDKAYAFMKRRGVKPVNTAIAILVAIGGVVFAVKYGEGFINEMIKVKSASALTHIQTQSLEGLDILTFLGIIPEAHYAESSPSRLFFTNGVFLTISLYMIGVMSLKRLVHHLHHTPDRFVKYKPIFYGMFFYQLSFLIGSINLPFTYMFFNMMMFSIFSGISFRHLY